MQRIVTIAGVLAFLELSLHSAFAQNGGYVIQTPGQPPTNVNPLPGGGYMNSNAGRIAQLRQPEARRRLRHSNAR